MKNKLYRYWNLQTNTVAWAETPEHFRKLTGEKSGSVVRCAGGRDSAPSGYKSTGTLANDPIVKRKDKQ